MEQGDQQGSERVLRELCKQAPKAEVPRRMLAQTLLAQNLPLRARKVLAPALRGAEDPGTLLVASRLAKRLLRPLDSRSFLEKAIRMDGKRPDLQFELAACLMELGHRDEAADLTGKIITQQPSLASAYWLRALLDLKEQDDEHLAQMEALLEAGTFSKRDRVSLHFSCARILQRKEDVEGEFRHLDEASATVLQQRPWSAAEAMRSHERIVTLLQEGMAGLEGGLEGGPDLAPLLVTSMPRSGSTLVERILGSHPDVAICGELGFVTAWASERQRGHPGARIDDLWSGQGSLSELMESLAAHVESFTEVLRIESPTFIEKSISNFDYLPFLLIAFPRAKVLHVQRDPLDAALSAYQLHFGTGNGYTYDLRAYAIRYRQHLQFMDAWRTRFPERIMTVQYEDLAQRPEENMRSMLSFCDLPWDPACLRFHEREGAVLTASSMQVRRPMNTASVGKHARYGQRLAPAAEELGIELP